MFEIDSADLFKHFLTQNWVHHLENDNEKSMPTFSIGHGRFISRESDRYISLGPKMHSLFFKFISSKVLHPQWRWLLNSWSSYERLFSQNVQENCRGVGCFIRTILQNINSWLNYLLFVTVALNLLITLPIPLVWIPSVPQHEKNGWEPVLQCWYCQICCWRLFWPTVCLNSQMLVYLEINNAVINACTISHL